MRRRRFSTSRRPRRGRGGFWKNRRGRVMRGRIGFRF